MVIRQSSGNAAALLTLKRRRLRPALASLAGAALLAMGTVMPVAAQDASEAPTDEVRSLLEGFDFGSGAAVVILGDERFDFGSAAETSEAEAYLGLCKEVFGIVAANLRLIDGREITVDMQIPPVDWDTYADGRYSPPSIEVNFDDPYQTWIADAEWATDNAIEGLSQVDTFERDGISATGTATFMEQSSVLTGQPSDPVQGTFEVRCAEE